MLIAVQRTGLRYASLRRLLENGLLEVPVGACDNAPKRNTNLRRRLLTTGLPAEQVSFRKQLKDEVKERRAAGHVGARPPTEALKDKLSEQWELTVGIEIHAQLNTERKLFSSPSPLLYWICLSILTLI